MRAPASVPASGRAGAAVSYAMAQVGDSYSYGAAGPDAFDCSGLTMMAWAQAGVGLPHSSSAQYGSGPHVASSALQPGDLVFYYQPISHVGIYIGNGMIVHAANPSTGVVVSGVYSMPYTGAVRPG
jgi:cell wall-associated NlpC family hydrolase